MFIWDLECLEESVKWIDILLFGFVVLVGMIFLIDWVYSVELFGFFVVYENSLDGVSDCDFIIEFFSNSFILMMYLLCFCEELIFWMSYEF